MNLDPKTFENMTPQEFAKTVDAMSDKEILEVMGGEQRVEILDAVFARFPGLFRPERAQGVEGVVHFNITGGPKDHPQDTYEIVIADDECTVSDEPGDESDVSLTMGPREFMRVSIGKGNPALLVMRGKVKVKGDLVLGSRFTSYFDIPKA